MGDSKDCAVPFTPVVCQQKPAAPFRESVDLKRSPAISRSLHQALFAQAKEVGMQLAAAMEWQIASDLTGVMPAPVSEGFEYEVLQFSALPHKRILPVFVSTHLFVTGTCKKAKRTRETAKACTFQKDPARKLACNFTRYVCTERFVSNAQKI
jgi:hypothetical protein